MLRAICVWIFILFAATYETKLQAQPEVAYLSASDTVFAEIHDYGMLVLQHEMKPQQTLYSLSKFYGLTLEELYSYNPSLRASYGTGDRVIIPLPKRAIVTQTPPKAMLPGLAKVFYKVRKGDTVYGVCTRTFTIAQADLLARNPHIAAGIQPGQLLHIGWMSTQPIPSDWQDVIPGGYYGRLNHPLKLEFIRRSEGRKIQQERGAATWPRNLSDDGGFYCLHRFAPVNGIVEVYNPQSKKTIYLKVSGRLPESVYDNNTLIIVSPLAAKALNVRDDRFYVHVKYY